MIGEVRLGVGDLASCSYEIVYLPRLSVCSSLAWNKMVGHPGHLDSVMSQCSEYQHIASGWLLSAN